jgi:hypothetical protein
MKRTLVAATLALLLWGMPALAGPPPIDTDSDGVLDIDDNCSEVANPAQDDTDLDDCGNLCDADYDNSGTPGLPDFGQFSSAYGTTDEEKVHRDPATGITVGIIDFGFFTSHYGVTPGPSGTTAGTTACP